MIFNDLHCNNGILFYNLPKFEKILSKTKVNYINVTNLSINSMNKDTLFEQQFPARAREIWNHESIKNNNNWYFYLKLLSLDQVYIMDLSGYLFSF